MVNEATRARIRNVRQGLQGVLDLLNARQRVGVVRTGGGGTSAWCPAGQERAEGEAFGVIESTDGM